MSIQRGEAQGGLPTYNPSGPDPVYVTGPIRVYVWEDHVHVCTFATMPDFAQVIAQPKDNPNPRYLRRMLSHHVMTKDIAQQFFTDMKAFFEPQGNA